ncbi:MAG: hypothetical protein KDK91_11120, partial [Gammaproteobacteria bacterium]|nr:hypothetical protein [Gammaproteobacteria bacterium]
MALAMLRERLAAPVASDAGCCEIRLEVTRAPSPAPATEKGREYTSWSVSGEAMTGIPGANEPPPTMPTTVEAPPASAAVTRTQDDGAAPPSTSSSTQLDEPEAPKPESAGDTALAARPVETRQSVSVAAEPEMAGDPPSRSTTASEAATTRVAEIRRAASVATALLAERRQKVSRARPPAPTRATPRPAAPPESIRKRAAKASL